MKNQKSNLEDLELKRKRVRKYCDYKYSRMML